MVKDNSISKLLQKNNKQCAIACLKHHNHNLIFSFYFDFKQTYIKRNEPAKFSSEFETLIWGSSQEREVHLIIQTSDIGVSATNEGVDEDDGAKPDFFGVGSSSRIRTVGATGWGPVRIFLYGHWIGVSRAFWSSSSDKMIGSDIERSCRERTGERQLVVVLSYVMYFRNKRGILQEEEKVKWNTEPHNFLLLLLSSDSLLLLQLLINQQMDFSNTCRPLFSSRCQVVDKLWRCKLDCILFVRWTACRSHCCSL